MQRHGWTLLFHEGVIVQLRKLQEAAARAEQNDSEGLSLRLEVQSYCLRMG